MENIEGKFEDFHDAQDFCEHDWKIVKLSAIAFEGHCERCGLVTTEILNAIYWHENQKEDPFIRIAGKKYRALKLWGNIAPCSDCGKIFFEVPLILWSKEDPSKAIVFCPDCAERILEPFIKIRVKG